jgi:hypothetical protein
MNRLHHALLAGICILGCAQGGHNSPSAAAAPAPGPKGAALAHTGPGFAVVELFTSEGCNTCPPADKLLAELSAEYPGKVFALGFHVDYWDRLGWKDRYSNNDYTARQQRYEHLMNVQSAYTPQAVVNGVQETVGSDKAKLESFIQAALQKANTYTLEAEASPKSTDKWTIKYHTNVPPKNGHDTGYPDLAYNLLNLAVMQKTAQSSVNAGENKGNVLDHINVVREFSAEGIARSGSGELTFKLPKDLSKENARLFLYAQDPYNGEILKAVEIPLP